jgi:hypothetical protein
LEKLAALVYWVVQKVLKLLCTVFQKNVIFTNSAVKTSNQTHRDLHRNAFGFKIMADFDNGVYKHMKKILLPPHIMPCSTVDVY